MSFKYFLPEFDETIEDARELQSFSIDKLITNDYWYNCFIEMFVEEVVMHEYDEESFEDIVIAVVEDSNAIRYFKAKLEPRVIVDVSIKELRDTNV